jgi:hypothetical protein
MITLRLVLLLLAFVCFALSAMNIPVPRFHLLSAGLALWVLTALIPAT